jgi:putative addiction module CopG family antidote
MARNTSITLGSHFLHFGDEHVVSGRYGSTSEVVQASLRLLEEREARRDSSRTGDIRYTSDPALVHRTLDAVVGSWGDLDTGKMIEDVHAARIAASRPADRP